VRSPILLLFLLLLPTLGGCIIDTVPLPEQQQSEDGDVAEGQVGIRVESLYWSDAPLLLVGTESAVPASMTVAVVNPDRAYWQGTATSTDNGSFNMSLNAALGDRIEMSILAGNVVIDSVDLLLESAPEASSDSSGDDMGETPEGAWLESGSVTAGEPDGDGIALVSGTAGSVAQGMTVVVANRTLGNSTAAQANPDGSFVAHIPAESGNELTLFAVETTSSHTGTTPLQVFVP
jgi:hypothetical protein